MQVVHRTLGVWRNRVDAFFTLTNFARRKFVDAGLPADRIHVKYNSVSPDPGVAAGAGGYVALVGRLSPEKGIATALAAWKSDGSLPPLAIVGDGPLRGEIEAAAARDPRITCHGELPNREAQQVIGDARLLLMPSLWYETFGRTIAEAYATATPVAASRLGAMAELVNDGVTGALFNAGDSADLARCVSQLTSLPVEEQLAMRRRARLAYERQFTPAHNYHRLLEIYSLALEAARQRQRAASIGTTPEPLKPTLSAG
jgi:glycosyltransferase involved in cell wall biosynthesis